MITREDQDGRAKVSVLIIGREHKSSLYMAHVSKPIQISGEPVIPAITSKYQVPDFSVIPQYDITT